MKTVDTQVVAVMFGVSEAVVRQWASRGKLQRVESGGRRAMYRWEDVQALYQERVDDGA